MNVINVERKTCRAPDGVELVYSAAGAGEPALIFVHGGLADRSFWDAQLKACAADHRVLALDLPGHGESGANRKKWGIPEFGADVRAVNGDLYPTDLASIRRIKPDFDAIIMSHMGHYPMLERPEEFNRHLAPIIAELSK